MPGDGLYAVVHFGVGLESRYPVASLAFLALIAAEFLAMIQAFNAVFGEATGRVVARRDRQYTVARLKPPVEV